MVSVQACHSLMFTTCRYASRTSSISSTSYTSCYIAPSTILFFFFLMTRHPPRSPLFPYPPLFRSGKIAPPSTLFDLRTQRIVGLATETGSPLPHPAIRAGSLKFPAVLGAAGLSEVASGDLLI